MTPRDHAQFLQRNMVPCDLNPIEMEHRNIVAVELKNCRIGRDVDELQLKRTLRRKRLQRGLGRVAQTAIRFRKKREMKHVNFLKLIIGH